MPTKAVDSSLSIIGSNRVNLDIFNNYTHRLQKLSNRGNLLANIYDIARNGHQVCNWEKWHRGNTETLENSCVIWEMEFFLICVIFLIFRLLTFLVTDYALLASHDNNCFFLFVSFLSRCVSYRTSSENESLLKRLSTVKVMRWCSWHLLQDSLLTTTTTTITITLTYSS